MNIQEAFAAWKEAGEPETFDLTAHFSQETPIMELEVKEILDRLHGHDLKEKIDLANFAAVQPRTDPGAAVFASEEYKASQARIAALEAQLESERQAKIAEQAAAFAEQHAPIPAAKPVLEALFTQAAEDDHAAADAKVTFSAGGETKTLSRVDALKAFVAAIPSTVLTAHFSRNPPPKGAHVLPAGASGSEENTEAKAIREAANAALKTRYPDFAPVGANGTS
jgi:hypothetical protein